MRDIRIPIPTLWYENDLGDRRLPDYSGGPDMPDGFKYQWSRFPCTVHEDVCCSQGRIASGSMSYSPALVLALTRPTLVERLRQLRRGHWMPRLSLPQAILVAATSCERCMNVLLWRAGTKDGYELKSAEWTRARTCCEMCSHEHD